MKMESRIRGKQQKNPSDLPPWTPKSKASAPAMIGGRTSTALKCEPTQKNSKAERRNFAHTFESDEDCSKRSVARIRLLAASFNKNLRKIGLELEACEADEPCGLTACPYCGRDVRRNVFANFKACPPSILSAGTVLTIGFEIALKGDLAAVDLIKIKQKFTKRLQRSLLSDAILVGGIEAAWHRRTQRWRVHGHVFVSRAVSVKELKSLGSGWAGTTKGSRKRQPIKDPGTQLSYLLKWVDGYRVDRQYGRNRPLLKPLPRPLREELIEWWSAHAPKDFVFLFGARRRGDGIEWLNL